MRHLYSLFLLSSLFLLTTTDSWCQQREFQWERSDRTAEGWMGGIGSGRMTTTPDGTTLIATVEGIFRIVERTESGMTEHYAELINDETEGPASFIGTIGERIYLVRNSGNSAHASADGGLTWGLGSEVWASSDNGFTWDLVFAEVGIRDLLVVGGDSLTGSVITAYDTESDSLLVFAPTGQHIATRGLPFPGDSTFTFPTMIASPSGLLYSWDEIGDTTQIFRSSDLGATWVPVAQAGLEGIRLYFPLHAGDSLLIGFTSDGLAASYDRGDSWTMWEWTRQDTSQDYKFWRYYSVAVSGEHIMVSWFNSLTLHDSTFPLIQSFDGGKSWTECGEAPTRSITLLEDGSSYCTEYGTLLRSDECGSPWKRVNGDFRDVAVTSVVSIENDFFAEIGCVLPEKDETRWRNYLMRSRDDGATWEPLMSGVISILKVSESGALYIWAWSSDTTSDTGDIVIEYQPDILRSTDRGETWYSFAEAGAPPPEEWPHFNSEWQLLQLQGEEYVLVYRDGPDRDSTGHPNAALSYSSDGGASFKILDSATLSGTTGVDYIQALLLPDGRIYGGPIGDWNESTLYGRFDPRTGVHEELTSPVPFTDMRIAPSGRLYGWTAEWRVPSRRDSAGRLFRSDDGGENWTEIITPDPQKGIDEMSEGVDGRLYLIHDRTPLTDRTYQSTDDGMTWNQTSYADLDIKFKPKSEPLGLYFDVESVDTLHDLHFASASYQAIDTLEDGYGRLIVVTMLLYSTNDEFQTWHPAYYDSRDDSWFMSYAVNNRGVIVVGNFNGGLYRSVESSGVNEEGYRFPVRIDLR